VTPVVLLLNDTNFICNLEIELSTWVNKIQNEIKYEPPSKANFWQEQTEHRFNAVPSKLYDITHGLHCYTYLLMCSTRFPDYRWSSYRLRVTRRVSLVERILPILPEHLSSHTVLSGVCVAQSLVFCVEFCKSLFVLLAIVLSFLPKKKKKIRNWSCLRSIFCHKSIISDQYNKNTVKKTHKIMHLHNCHLHIYFICFGKMPHPYFNQLLIVL
jgi:hypothetical protein